MVGLFRKAAWFAVSLFRNADWLAVGFLPPVSLSSSSSLSSSFWGVDGARSWFGLYLRMVMLLATLDLSAASS